MEQNHLAVLHIWYDRKHPGQHVHDSECMGTECMGIPNALQPNSLDEEPLGAIISLHSRDIGTQA